MKRAINVFLAGLVICGLASCIAAVILDWVNS